MSTLAPGSRRLTTRHLSIRVPWHDTDWTGHVCANPKGNASCMILKRIYADRDDEAEQERAGQAMEDLDRAARPPCMSERVTFMRPTAGSLYQDHAYRRFSERHKHFIETEISLPPYSAACIPYRWMRVDDATELAQRLSLGFRPELEPDLGFKTAWVQQIDNQRVMLDTFFSAIRPTESLCFFYAKRTPLSDDARRVIVGVARVRRVGEGIEYRYDRPAAQAPWRGMLWERVVEHSLRPGGSDGFLLPYHRALEQAARDPSIDLEGLVAFAPDESFDEYSDGSEHVTHDSAIQSLLACRNALEAMGKVVPGDLDAPMAWINEELGRLWRLRGPYPGLGAALVAFGFTQSGVLIAQEIGEAQRLAGQEWNEDPWPLVEEVLNEPAKLGPELSSQVDRSVAARWPSLLEPRRALLKLLARFSLTPDQATRFYVSEERKRRGHSVSDADLLQNPYLLFELDRHEPDAISLHTIDRGLFPDRVVREKHPIPAPACLEGALDARRLRAMFIYQLELAQSAGHTLLGQDQLIQKIREMEVDPPCSLSGDDLGRLEGSLTEVMVRQPFADGSPAWQLKEQVACTELIRRTVTLRQRGRPHAGTHDWQALLARRFGPMPSGDEEERLAREEKAAALEALYRNRISVLVGPAGTGKTTLLQLLCERPDIVEGGVTLLAPTGKARVRMETQIKMRGATIAQFLTPHRYDARTQRYHLSAAEKRPCGKTVIIDEASMLTEDQLAAVIEAMEAPDRLILVGDPRQLPPIGAGRPFVDIVRQVAPEEISGARVKVAGAYAELTVLRRQRPTGGEAHDPEPPTRADLQLAEWFSGRPPSSDAIWAELKSGRGGEHLDLIQWDTEEDLRTRMLEALVKHLKLTGLNDELGFAVSIGATLDETKRYAYFNSTWIKDGQVKSDGAGPAAENWQALSPMRGLGYGVESLNRLIQQHFRAGMRDLARGPHWKRKVPSPMGREEIVYGDKVINLRNHRRDDMYPAERGAGYVANGEIGIAVGQFKRQNAPYKGAPWKLEVEFSSQKGVTYGYSGRDMGEESEPVLSLAYALTVHKAQGSEFGIVFLIIPQSCPILSRELLYTAFTRQKDRLVILHQGEVDALKTYTTDAHSETARRLTNLFKPPQPWANQEHFLEEGLIHRTVPGYLVRSKSEVIIANLLHQLGLRADYERKLVGPDGGFRYPDFTIDDPESGLTVYWEHLGMLSNARYRRDWEKKLAWYRAIGVGIDDFSADGRRLVTSVDGPDGSIDSAAIAQQIAEVFGR